MTQAAHAIAYNVQKALHYRERIIFSLIAIIIFFVGAYIYMIREAIVNVVARQGIAQEIQTDTTNVNNLQGQYFTLKNSINLATATSLGFTQVAVSAFIPVTAADHAETLTFSGAAVPSSNNEI